MSTQKRILLAVSNPEVFANVEKLIDEANASVERAYDGEQTLAAAEGNRFHLIVVEYPLQDTTGTEMIESLLDKKLASRSASLVVMTSRPYALALRRLDDRRLTVCSGIPESLKVIAHALGTTNRLADRLLVLLEMVTGSSTIRRACQTTNISASGMLIRSSRLVPIGSVLPVSIELPYGSPVRGRAQVVRHTDLESEQISGMAMRFVALEGDGSDRLGGFVQTERSRSLPTHLS